MFTLSSVAVPLFCSATTVFELLLFFVIEISKFFAVNVPAFNITLDVLAVGFITLILESLKVALLLVV